MKQHEITNGSRMVIISEYSTTQFGARLYLNNGETASLQCWKGKTLRGAQKWAKRILGN